MDTGQRIRVLGGADAGKTGTIVGVHGYKNTPKFDIKLDNGRNYDLAPDEVEPVDK
ncbi:MAG: KOW motif-containing protein [Dehalococcoidales bacterium]